MIGELQMKMIESVRKCRFSKAIWKDSGLTYDKFHANLQYLTRRKLVKRVAPSTYEVDEEQVKKNMIPGRYYGEKEAEEPNPPFEYDLSKVPQNLQDWIWKNKELPCSYLKKKTGVSRFYIRQIIYERLSTYEQRTN